MKKCLRLRNHFYRATGVCRIKIFNQIQFDKKKVRICDAPRFGGFQYRFHRDFFHSANRGSIIRFKKYIPVHDG